MPGIIFLSAVSLFAFFAFRTPEPAAPPSDAVAVAAASSSPSSVEAIPSKVPSVNP